MRMVSTTLRSIRWNAVAAIPIGFCSTHYKQGGRGGDSGRFRLILALPE
jgi:hypothetical protein